MTIHYIQRLRTGNVDSFFEMFLKKVKKVKKGQKIEHRTQETEFRIRISRIRVFWRKSSFNENDYPQHTVRTTQHTARIKNAVSWRFI